MKKDLTQMLFDMAVGTLYYVPNSECLNGLVYSKQFFFHEMFLHDTNCFYAVCRDERGALLLAKVYDRKVKHCIKVRGLPLWIKYDELVNIPERILTATQLQFADPSYISDRIRYEKAILDLDEAIGAGKGKESDTDRRINYG